MSRIVLHIGRMYHTWRLRRLLGDIRTRVNHIKSTLSAKSASI